LASVLRPNAKDDEMEHRKDKRFSEQNLVRLKSRAQASGPADNAGIAAYTQDLSLSGAHICCKKDFPVGHIVRIAIDLERTHQSVKVDGQVIWTRKSDDGENFDMGVVFLHSISETILSLIRHFYAKQARIPSSVS
jgi:Tfp pilus assembly protein PilZ